MNSQTSRKTNEIPDCTKRRLRVQKTSPVWNETKSYKMTFPPFFSGNSRKSLQLSTRIARVISSEELGTMCKNNLRRITLVRGPIWGIHSLTLIISCFCLYVDFGWHEVKIKPWQFWRGPNYFSSLWSFIVFQEYEQLCLLLTNERHMWAVSSNACLSFL